MRTNVYTVSSERVRHFRSKGTTSSMTRESVAGDTSTSYISSKKSRISPSDDALAYRLHALLLDVLREAFGALGYEFGLERGVAVAGCCDFDLAEGRAHDLLAAAVLPIRFLASTICCLTSVQRASSRKACSRGMMAPLTPSKPSPAFSLASASSRKASRFNLSVCMSLGVVTKSRNNGRDTLHETLTKHPRI